MLDFNNLMNHNMFNKVIHKITLNINLKKTNYEKFLQISKFFQCKSF